MDGFINILKPQGPTASDMVVRLRGILKQKKIGHLGTLDRSLRSFAYCGRQGHKAF